MRNCPRELFNGGRTTVPHRTAEMRPGPLGPVRSFGRRYARVRLVFNFINCIARTTADCAVGIRFGDRSTADVNTISSEVAGAPRPIYYKILGTLRDKLGADSARLCAVGRRPQIALGERYSPPPLHSVGVASVDSRDSRRGCGQRARYFRT